MAKKSTGGKTQQIKGRTIPKPKKTSTPKKTGSKKK